MRSIGTRLVFWYAVSATLTLLILFLVGYKLLEGGLIHGLDELNAAEFRQLRAHLGANYKTLNSRTMDQRIREISELGSTLFYIYVEQPKANVRFSSHNLHGWQIPDVKGARAYSVPMPAVGLLRVDEFLMPPFDVTIATSARPVTDAMREYSRVCLALLVAMLAASIGIGLALSRLMLRPIRAIRQTAGRIGSHNLSDRIPVAAVKDEISDLARLLNRMFDRLESAFDQVRRFADDASHELKTPLSLIRLHAEKMLGDGQLSASHTEAVLVQIEELARLNQLIDELLFLSRAEAKAVAFDRRRRDPALFLESFSQDAQVLAEHTGQRFELDHQGAGLALFDEKWLRQVLLNLLSNALEVSPPDGLVRLQSKLGASAWRVSVEDEGPGLADAEQHERIFERFVRFGGGEAGDRGSGLGLAIARSVIDLHAGHIFAEARAERRGLRVVFEIPTAETPSPA
ncbi:MAG: HAMP domain-containing sensor histidine kinase [Caulobacteraceae bacterium]